jgi:hypothetical protein
MFPQATILLHKEETSVDRHLAHLTDFWGVQCRMVHLGLVDHPAKILSAQESVRCVMISARSLAAILEDETIPSEVVAHLLEQPPFVFIYGISPRESEVNAVRHLTGGLVSNAVSFDDTDHLYQVSRFKEITEEFSGLAFGPIHRERDFGLMLNRSQTGFSEIVTIGNLPLFGLLKKQNSSMFLLACRDIVDIEAQNRGSLSAAEYFSQIAPVLMFLKYAFREHAWHNPKRCACFVIDDPLLRKSYGFLNYSRLLAEMDGRQFTSTIAFIPWNYRRTDRDVARLVRERSDRFKVCVHGCDHTAGEFATANVTELNTRIHLATQRMRTHEQLTGVPYDEVMVFPQGRFSSVSLKVLKGHNYLAAVNSSAIPEDLPGAHGLTVADLLAPAILRYGGFPLFVRRYPRKLADFAFDLFLGKPALIVEHHDYFKDGYDTIREFITRINSLSEKLQWMSLGQLIKHTCLQKTISDDTTACRTFANCQVIQNPAGISKRFVITKSEEGNVPVRRILVDGKQHPFVIEDGCLQALVNIPAAGQVEMNVEYANPHRYDMTRDAQTIGYRLKVHLRRYMSEVRDNYLCGHEKLISLAYRIKNHGLPG